MALSGGKISFLQLVMLLMLVNGLMNHVILNPIVLDASGRDAWLVPIFSALFLLPWCLLLVYFMKKSGQQKLQPWLAQRTHPAVSWILIVPLYIQIYLIGMTTLLQTSIWTVTNYLPATPRFALSLTLIVVCAYCAISGLRTIAISAGVLLPFVVVLGYFVMIANMPNKEYDRLFPMLEFGMKPVMDGMLYAGSGFMEFVLILALQQHLKTRIKSWQILILALLFIHIMLGPIVGAITEFGPEEAAKQTESPYEQWRLVKVGDSIEHVDFFSVFQWLAGTMVRISLSLFLLGDMLSFSLAKYRNRFIACMALSYLLITLMPITQQNLYEFMHRYYFHLSLIVILGSTLIWTLISVTTKTGKEGTS
ncbi:MULTISPECIES: endospore germination permease [unclassified Paenibacillus]|uniref:GerAB/ArcD/ProY family transporter n=1 Tax=unclassified Paenibacillus TaxID=185978 RepID=UPI00020D7B91|nr:MULTISPECIES: endospore germination permease [unclassified Paenibacillus]EGL19217.1 spore germination protein XB [Paenibacillus sp. HGF7]EPD81163.1 spore germination protein (amino acid permease) [Paenibacillus sp. HGH0039]